MISPDRGVEQLFEWRLCKGVNLRLLQGVDLFKFAYGCYKLRLSICKSVTV